jgi:hypothetical protein
VATVARIVLGVVFLAAGALKLRDPGWPAAASALGTPAWMVPVVGPAEIVVGALLAAGVAPPWPAVAALAMLAAFTAALARVLLSGARPVCACFGRVSARPVGPPLAQSARPHRRSRKACTNASSRHAS